MQLGDIANAEAAEFGKPLDGIRILAAEQMQALPFATQLMARLGAEVVKVEHPERGESGRGSSPSMTDPQGREVGATFLRNNFNKRSIGLDLRSDEGREIFLSLVPKFDVVAENFKAGTMDRLGLGYDTIAEVNPQAIYCSISGFGNTIETPYKTWPAYASVIESMSGIYNYKRRAGERPTPNPMGAIGDITAALFSTVGVLAALRHREKTGLGQYVDIAMLDGMVAMTDLVMNFHSLGMDQEPDPPPFLIETIDVADGAVVFQMVREHQFEALADMLDKPEWKTDERFAERTGWAIHWEDVIRPAVEAWGGGFTRLEACAKFAEAGVVSGPVHTSPEVVTDPHVVARDMVVEMARTDGNPTPVMVPGNPIKMSRVARGPETRVPWVGEHTADVLTQELGLSPDEIVGLAQRGVVTPEGETI